MKVGLAAADETHYSYIGRAYSVFGSKVLDTTHGASPPLHGACPIPLFHAHEFRQQEGCCPKTAKPDGLCPPEARQQALQPV